MIGKLIKQPTGYTAFIPDKFPPEFDIPMDQEMLQLQYWATHYLAKLDGITQLLPDVDFFILMYIRKEAALSSQIEGTKATMIDAIEAEGAFTQGLPEDVYQIQKYIEAMNYGLKRIETLPLSLRLIREVHKILLSHPKDSRFTPGEFRRSQNWIGGETIEIARFVPPPPDAMHHALDDFEKFLYKENYYTPLIQTGIAHTQFETIHPFLDGNGRTGRLLITFYLVKQGVLDKPVLYISEYFKKHRQTYFDLLYNYHIKGDIVSWLKFFLEGIAQTAKDAIETSRKINSLREQDMEKVHSLGQTAKIGMSILKNLYKLPIVEVNKISEWSGYTRQGAYKLIDKFVDLGILEQKNTSKEYGKKYVYKKYLDIFA